VTGRNPTLERLTMALTANGAHSVVRIIFQLSTDAELIDSYQRTTGIVGDPTADLLLAEIQRRELLT
jgi:hypothetical protein